MTAPTDARQAALEAELAPCPFCGNPPYPYIQEASIPTLMGGWKQQVWCRVCDFAGPRADTKDKAIAAWNRRPAILAERQRAAEEIAAYLDDYAGGHYMAKSCAAAVRALALPDEKPDA